jgi:hypothetical protein
MPRGLPEGVKRYRTKVIGGSGDAVMESARHGKYIHLEDLPRIEAAVEARVREALERLPRWPTNPNLLSRDEVLAALKPKEETDHAH